MFIRLLGFFLMCEMMWNVLYLWRYSEAHVYCNWFVTCAIHMLIKSGCFCFLGVISLMKSVQFPDFWEIRTQSTRDSETLLLEAPPYFLPMLILFFCEVGKTLMEAVETPRLLAPPSLASLPQNFQSKTQMNSGINHRWPSLHDQHRPMSWDAFPVLPQRAYISSRPAEEVESSLFSWCVSLFQRLCHTC